MIMLPDLDVTIKKLTQNDQKKYFLHCKRAVQDSGSNGTPPYTPMGRDTIFSSEKQKKTMKALTLKPTKPGWTRIWALWYKNNIIGNIKLDGGQFESNIHRAWLSIGIDNPTFRGKGIGKELMDLAITWARGQASLHWIDLGVFTINKPALILYQKLGFIEHGFAKDIFRIDDIPYDNIYMTLNVSVQSD